MFRVLFNQFAEIIIQGNETFLHYRGFLYVRRLNGANGKIYCRSRKQDGCSASLITISYGGEISVLEGGEDESHSHAPHPDEISAIKVLAGIREHASANPEIPPERCLRPLSGIRTTVKTRRLTLIIYRILKNYLLLTELQQPVKIFCYMILMQMRNII